MKIQKTIIREIRKLWQYNLTTILWILSQFEKKYKYNSARKRPVRHDPKSRRINSHKNKYNTNHQDITPPHSNTSSKEKFSKKMNSTLALNVEHEIHSRNILPATDIERGWIIDSGVSAHMTPFKRDCKT